jgi:hypothetical protein
MVGIFDVKYVKRCLHQFTSRKEFHISISYITIETKEVACIEYNRFLIPHKYSGEGRDV